MTARRAPLRCRHAGSRHDDVRRARTAGEAVAFLRADLIGRVFAFLLALHGVGALRSSLSVLLRKFSVARPVVRPLIAREISRAGVKLLPMFLFASLALGFLVIGQTVSVLTRVGRRTAFGDIMVIVVVRELGPLLTAFLVLGTRGHGERRRTWHGAGDG